MDAGLIPVEAGLIIADQWGAEIIRASSEHPLHASRKRAVEMRVRTYVARHDVLPPGIQPLLAWKTFLQRRRAADIRDDIATHTHRMVRPNVRISPPGDYGTICDQHAVVLFFNSVGQISLGSQSAASLTRPGAGVKRMAAEWVHPPFGYPRVSSSSLFSVRTTRPPPILPPMRVRLSVAFYFTTSDSRRIKRSRAPLAINKRLAFLQFARRLYKVRRSWMSPQ